MFINEAYNYSIFPSEPVGRIGLMVMRTIRELPGADLLTVKVFREYLDRAETWQDTPENRRIIQCRARDITLFVVGIASVYSFVGTGALLLGSDPLNCYLYSTAAWVQICIFLKDLDI